MVKLMQSIINFQRIKAEDVTTPTPSSDIQLMTTCILRYLESYKEVHLNKMGSATH